VRREHCPICSSAASEPFISRRGVPVHQNVPFPTTESARAIARGDLEMCACPACGFVFNAAFDPVLVDYGPAYENSQAHSPAFNAHLDQLVEHLVVGCGVSTGRVVEVGCGQGLFLRRLLAHPRASGDGVGYDPAYTGPPEVLEGRIRFVSDFYGPDTMVPADAVVCRHVIEHIPDPLSLLRTVRAGVGTSGSTRVFFETPCAEWILRNRVPWDFFYEHCSLFTAHSLALALASSGFAVTGVRHVFGGQYLWAEGQRVDQPDPELHFARVPLPELGGAPGPRVRVPGDPSGPATLALARVYATEERTRVTGWRSLLDDLCPRGSVFAWGAGAKGVTYCNLVDPGGARLAGVVDVNPAKQGKFIPGTGLRIVPPEAVAGAAAVLVFNPNYMAEICSEVERLAPGAEVIDLMREEVPCN
jgi:hypothetical protein